MKLYKVGLISVVAALLVVVALLWMGMQRKDSPGGAGFRSGPVPAAKPSLHQPVSEERRSAAPADSRDRAASGGGQHGAAAREEPTADFHPAVREFHRWAGRYADETDPAGKRALIEIGRELARAHRATIKQLIPEDPQRALEQAVPMAVRQHLPGEILSLIEERINTRATFEVYAVGSGDSEPIRRVVETPARRYEAHVYGRRLTQPTTREDYLVGIAVDERMAVAERPLRVLEALEQPNPAKPLVRISPDDNGPAPRAIGGDERPEHAAPPFGGKAPLVEAGGTVYQLCCPGCLGPFERELVAFEGGTGGPVYPSHPVASTSSTGARSVLYLRVAFPDVLLEPQTEKAAYDMMSQVNAWFVESSYGNLYLLTTVAPIVVLPRTEAWYKNGGSEYDLRNDALAVAKALGYDGDAHDHVIFAYSGGPGNFQGMATVAGKYVWLRSINVSTAAHELGHNFGLWHANFWDTGGLSVIGPGTNVEYGNNYDTMGDGNPLDGHFNAAWKNQIGWLRDEFVHDIRQSGTYRIYALDQPRLDPARRFGLKVRKDADRSYWAEFRQLFGPSNPWLQDGILLNWSPWNKSDGGTQLLDTTPGSPDGKNDAALAIGRTFSDLESGVHLTPVGKGGTIPEAMDVVVNLGSFPGNRLPIAVVSANQANVSTGTAVDFTATASDADGDILAYSWDFGDNTFSNNNLPAVAKSWGTAGKYVVRCLVSDMKGGTASDSVIVTVGSSAAFSISGQITSGGQPLANVRVHNGQSGSNYRGAYTDSDGTYTVSGLTAGNVTLSAVLYGYSFTAGFANPVAVGPDFIGANFTAQETVRLSITATDPTATEGGDTATITLSRSGSTASPLKVKRSGILGTAEEFEYTITPEATYDFSLLSFVYTIPAGQSAVTLTITAENDGVSEGPETLTLEFQSAATYNIFGDSSATVTLFDSGLSLPMVSVEALDADAGETGDSATFIVSRVGSTASALTVPFNLSGSAGNGIDYAVIATSVVIPAGQSSTPILVTPINDSMIEGVEEVILALAASASYFVSPASGAASAFITDDDIPTVTLDATDAVASEAGQDPATFVVTRSGNTSTPITVNYAIAGSAQHGVDYAVLPGVVTIPAGSSASSITIVPVDDTIGEPAQTVVIQLRGGTTYLMGSPASATSTLTDNDLPVVTVGVSDATCAEPADAGQFKFTTAGTGSGNITVRYTVTGTAASGTDYTALVGTLSMGRNTTATVSVAVLDDVLPEDLETVTVTIEPDPAYTTFLDKTATLNLLDNERNIVNAVPFGSSLDEAGGASLTYYVSRQGATTSALTVTYGMGGIASNGVDYETLSGTAVIAAGQSGVNVTAAITDDSLLEGTETATLTLTPAAGYGIGIASATHYITDNEVPVTQASFASATDSGSESAGTVNIPVTLSEASATPVTVEYAIAGGSATGGIDYTLAAGMLTFDPGVTSVNIPLTIIDDLFDEPAQTVIVEIKNAWNASLGTSSHTYTINDNDNPPPVTAGFAAAFSAGGENVSPAVLLVTLSAAYPTPVTVNYAATSGTATGGGVDYTLAPGTVTFAPGETVQSIPITIIDDTLNEANETVIVTLDGPVGATLNANTTHTYTINLNDDTIASYEVSAPSPQTAGVPFLTTVTAKNVYGNPVTTDSTTVVTMTGTGSVQYDSDGNGTFDDYTKTLSNGTFTISTKDAVVEAVTLTATDGHSKTGSSSSITILNAFYGAWMAGYTGLTGINNLPGDDRDGDGLTNLQEYAFGMNPINPTLPGIAHGSGVLTSTGPPYAANFAAGTGWDFGAVFCRRVNYASVVLTYTVQFSADNAVWVDSTATPTVLATDAGGVMEAVSVPYPLFIRPGGVVKKAQFFRVGVSMAP